jgi:hypothetical protein
MLTVEVMEVSLKTEKQRVIGEAQQRAGSET